MRSERIALHAHEHDFPVITSSLGISRLKNMKQINDCGHRAAAAYQRLVYREHNWRKGGGTARMVEISKRERFCQQAHCGCVCSLPDSNRHRHAQGRKRLELGVSYYGDSPAAARNERRKAGQIPRRGTPAGVPVKPA
jgi:epoxyqueuosine reductase